MQCDGEPVKMTDMQRPKIEVETIVEEIIIDSEIHRRPDSGP